MTVAAILGASAPAQAASEEPLVGAAQALVGVVTVGDAGFDVAAVGDLDGDGSGDLMVGAPFGDARKGLQAGAAYLFYGPVNPSARSLGEADAVFLGGLPGSFVGEDLGAVGDLDGDGFDELLVGAPGSVPGLQAGSPRAGAAYLFHGGRDRLSGEIVLEDACLQPRGACDAVFRGVHEVDFFGFGLPNSSIGDHDGDGKDDLLVGAAGHAGFGGAAYLFYGRDFMGEVEATDANATFVGAPFSFASRPMTGAGDLDGDGYDDFAIGAPADFAGNGPPGVVSVYYGRKSRRRGTDSALAADAVLADDPSGGSAGRGLAGAADVDGDGLDDLLIGAPGLWTPVAISAGRVHLVYGSTTRLTGRSILGSVPGQAVLHGPERGNAGMSVALADLNNDGRAEAVVGAPLARGFAGEVAVFCGRRARRVGPTPWAGADRVLTGAGTQRAGFGLAAGRFNRHRFARVLVGAPRHVVTTTRPGGSPDETVPTRLGAAFLLGSAWGVRRCRAPARR